MSRASRGPRTIAVASGKGGVGKTWLSISLATSYARSGRRVLLVDGDFGLANVDVQLGLVPDRDIGDLFASDNGLASGITRFDDGGFDVLAGRAGSGALSTLPAAELERLLMLLAEEDGYDLVLVDLGAGIDRATRRMACWADTLCVVTTDEPTALTDAYVVIKLHVQDKRRLWPDAGDAVPIDARVVVNQATTGASGEQTFATLARVCQAYLGMRPVHGGVIRRDDRVRDAIRAQVPLPLRYPASAAATDVERAAASLARSVTGR